jgi:response regulator RpfG family c-di-GMP phosphodiesterase
MTSAGIARILVIDDEPQIRKFLRISLNAYGYEVIEAVRGEDQKLGDDPASPRYISNEPGVGYRMLEVDCG